MDKQCVGRHRKAACEQAGAHRTLDRRHLRRHICRREPDRVQKLLLVTAPLRFGPVAGGFALVVSGSMSALTVAELFGGVPGSLLDVASCAGAPEEFIAGRWQDACASLLEPGAILVHQRVVRWTLDEFAQPARLFAEIVEQLYRADAFARGELRLPDKQHRRQP